ncbi:uncharacterized protein N7511_004625 [Penicillium nucicola]|uniref:uncharacterized protein n=1 Tax=Penicillium nucicola TaxID=1850975 RepID=UPI0025456609|nr:uncharacterized protein N7511_004625 [Penicillium nucicola]KAJ5767009.1 hypothetical protein N7511_004625 [Penicillium nucicola]
MPSTPTPPTILLLGTCDTKLPELLYTKAAIESQTDPTTNQHLKVHLLDIGRTQTAHSSITTTQQDLLTATQTQPPDTDISTLPRAEYIKTLTPHATTFTKTLFETASIHGILAIGGSCGTALASAVMRDALPIGFPKMMVSTMASGDVAPYIGETDICMMYSVVDIAGRNRVLEGVLENTAGGIGGMAGRFLLRSTGDVGREGEVQGEGAVQVAISMFGVTTPAVTRAREYLESVLAGCEVYVFHATGSGGRAMERLIREGRIDAVLDLTTTEIADEVVGGVLSAGPERLCAATAAGIPRVVSVGACDMVNFGGIGSVPASFRGETGKGRLFHEHNETVTLMRTTKEECVQIGKVIARNLMGKGTGKTKVVLPVGGVSMIDVPGGPFWDPEVDEVLFSTLEDELKGSGIEVVRDSRAINDPGFAVLAADALVKLIRE